jgi:hypothetical protein
MIEDATEKFDIFRARPVVRAIIDNEYTIALITCQTVEDAMKKNTDK